MATTQESIGADLKTAMKQRDSERVGTLRLLLTAIKNRRIELGRDLEEDELLALVRREIKQLREAAEGWVKADRQQEAIRTESQITFLESYLPPAVEEAEIRAAIESFIADEGLAGPRAMGPVMKAMIGKFGSAAEPAQISRIAKELLGR